MPTSARRSLLLTARILPALSAALWGACHAAEGPTPLLPAGEPPEQTTEPVSLPEIPQATGPTEGQPSAALSVDAGMPLPIIPEERTALCARPADDAVRDIFCKGERPTVSSLRELLRRLEIRTLPEDMDEASAAELVLQDMGYPVPHAVLLGHSTALSGQLVSPINPRAILIGKGTLVAFQRGVQKVEIATVDRGTGHGNFYLLTFAQACNQTAAGCGPGDLYTLAVESDFTHVTLRDAEDLKNTPLDCRQCHQRGREHPTLLMRELLGPWQHFFFIETDAVSVAEGDGVIGGELVRDYLKAKGTETYAGLATNELRQTAGVTLQLVVGSDQPLVFNPSVTDQLRDAAALGLPRRSEAWQYAYDAFKRGEQQALPYFEQRATDPKKQAALTEAYAQFKRGALGKDALPDLGDIFPDDPQTRAEIGLQTEPGASGPDLLIQACGSCHNDVLDQTISRARFSIALGRMDRAERELAVKRIALPAEDPLVMPPHGMRQLDAAGKARLTDYLASDSRSEADDMRLDRVARGGMVRALGGY
jgi:hypothetical protein